MSPEKIAIIGAVATVVAGLGGAALGAFITYRVSTMLSAQSRFNEAAAKFSSAFTGIRLYLEFGWDEYEGNNIKINDLLGKHAEEHLAAIINFKPFLSKYERTCIDKAWDHYCHPDGIPLDRSEKEAFIFDDYYQIQEASGDQKTKTIALEKLNNILRFANLR